jgi:hypothetical protein
MKLRDVVIPITVIETSGGMFSVRGISLEDIQVVAADHGPSMLILYNKVTAGEDVTKQEIQTIIKDLLPQFSTLFGAIIAAASDDYCEKTVEVARKLPFHKQAEALEAIFRLTFSSEAELGKFMESIIRMMSGARGLLDQMRLPLSELGSGAFVNE